MIIDEIEMAAIRTTRDRLLSDTDWTQLNDSKISVEKREKFAEYRQALRDIPNIMESQKIEAGELVWPEKP